MNFKNLELLHEKVCNGLDEHFDAREFWLNLRVHFDDLENGGDDLSDVSVCPVALNRLIYFGTLLH